MIVLSVTAQLTCAIVFAYACCWFSYDADQFITCHRVCASTV